MKQNFRETKMGKVISGIGYGAAIGTGAFVLNTAAAKAQMKGADDWLALINQKTEQKADTTKNTFDFNGEINKMSVTTAAGRSKFYNFMLGGKMSVPVGETTALTFHLRGERRALDEGTDTSSGDKTYRGLGGMGVKWDGGSLDVGGFVSSKATMDAASHYSGGGYLKLDGNLGSGLSGDIGTAMERYNENGQWTTNMDFTLAGRYTRTFNLDSAGKFPLTLEGELRYLDQGTGLANYGIQTPIHLWMGGLRVNCTVLEDVKLELGGNAGIYGFNNYQRYYGGLELSDGLKIKVENKIINDRINKVNSFSIGVEKPFGR